MKIIDVVNVSYVYNQGTPDEVVALKDISLDISEGEFVVMLGENGSGKSTLAKMLNGLLLPTKGHIEVFGMLTSDEEHTFDIRKKVGVVFQNPDNQMIASIVEDDVAFGPENIGLPREEIIERVQWALSSVGMLEHAKDTPFKMSGGQKQRIAIAGVLALSPAVIVLDESTAMLDPRGRKEVMDVVTKLNREHGITVIHITHHMEEAVKADKIFVLRQGKIEKIGAPKDIFTDIETLNRAKLVLPIATDIARKLNAAGLPISTDILDEHELEEALCRLK